jgi:hypothetical protein
MRTNPYLDSMKDWVDYDDALHYVGFSLGVFREGEVVPKHILWSKNAVCDGLVHIVEELVNMGLLLKSGDDHIKVNPDFDIYKQDDKT